MREIELEKGESIKITGQEDTWVIIENIGGNIFNRLGDREIAVSTGENKNGNN